MEDLRKEKTQATVFIIWNRIEISYPQLIGRRPEMHVHNCQTHSVASRR